MVREAEDFASEDTLQRKKIETLNSLSSYIFGLNSQLSDQEGLGAKISDEDKKTLSAVVKDAGGWTDEHGREASLQDLEAKLDGAFIPCPAPRWF
jgi:heat shock protein 5